MVSKRVVQHRLFAFADLACVSASIILWEMEPRLAWRPLLVGLLPWLFRLSTGCFPFRRTHFELPIAIFLLTAAIGVWAAYGREDASSKFWLLIGGVLLYYSLAGQPQDNLWALAGFMSLIGVGIACFFLFTNDWGQYPAKIGLLNRVGLRWMTVRPAIRITGVHPNSAGGVIAVTSPFLAAIGMKAWKDKRMLLGAAVVMGGSLMSAGFLLATSRGAALALAAGMGLWLLWLLSKRVQHFFRARATTVFGVGLILLIILAAGFALVFPGGPVALANSIPGPPNTGTRLELAGSAVELVGDFPFTGGGLNSFPGLYSHYIRGTPFYITLNSHNMFLDVALEQGILGMLAFCCVYLGSFYSMVSQAWKPSQALLVWASLASTLIVVLHGLVDNVVYGRWGAAIVFFLPGIAYAITRSSLQGDAQHPSLDLPVEKFATRSRYRQGLIGVTVVACVAFLMAVYGYRRPILAAWYADLGAVRMARTELAGFPQGKWAEEGDLATLAPAERLFEKALRYNTGNRTANHRLGLVAMGRRDFSAAVSFLEIAYEEDDDHRGIRKALGCSYVWTGQFDPAIGLLADIPEASYEMGVYSWWWTTQSRDDLAERAETMAKRLNALELAP